jgi:hypothetical protein
MGWRDSGLRFEKEIGGSTLPCLSGVYTSLDSADALPCAVAKENFRAKQYLRSERRGAAYILPSYISWCNRKLHRTTPLTCQPQRILYNQI